MKRMYTHKEVSRLIGVSEGQIRYWDKVALIPATEKRDGRLWFDFKALVAFRTVRDLREKGVSTHKIIKCIKRLKSRMPQARQPLTEFKITLIGDEIIVGKDRKQYTADGQILIDFDRKGIPTPLVSLSTDLEADLFFQALELEDNGDAKLAEKKYEALLEQEPDHTDALVNIGNIRFMSGDPETAENCYRRALCIDPDHVEANFNLANMFDDRGEPENAMLFYIKALYEDPEFPDAHCNLGMVLDKLGNREAARQHWRIYLELEPDGRMARFVQARLEE